MIEQFILGGEGPNLDLLIVDEAQDLTPLQWRMIREVRSGQGYLYAGDDDQCIYSWMGVDVKDFMNASENVTVLDKSYRLPGPVYKVAQDIIRRVAVRQDKSWTPNDHTGSVRFHHDIMNVDLRTGEWLILGRTNHIVNKVASDLKEMGYLFWREVRVGPSPENSERTGGMDPTMQRRKIYPNGNEDFWLVLEEGSYQPPGKKTLQQFRPRDRLLSRRTYRELQHARIARDALDQGAAGIGEGGTVHSLYPEERREDSGGCEAEVRLSTIHKAKGGRRITSSS